MSEFKGQTCVVTGGRRGIGRAIVEMLAEEGAEVYSLDITMQPASDQLDNVKFCDCDVADLSAVNGFFSRLQADGRQVDILVNNAAAITRVAPITELSPDEWQRAISVNITGIFNVTRSALPLMPRGGRIINIASTFGHVGSPGRVAYATTKGAILAFTRCLALDTAALGIRVNSISPGGIATDRLAELFGSPRAAEEALSKLHPIGRTGTPADIANAVWYLASRRSAFMTGADLLVDGGYTAQ